MHQFNACLCFYSWYLLTAGQLDIRDVFIGIIHGYEDVCDAGISQTPERLFRDPVIVGLLSDERVLRT